MANAVTSSQCTQLNAAVRVVVYAVIKQNPSILSAGFALIAVRKSLAETNKTLPDSNEKLYVSFCEMSFSVLKNQTPLFGGL